MRIRFFSDWGPNDTVRVLVGLSPEDPDRGEAREAVHVATQADIDAYPAAYAEYEKTVPAAAPPGTAGHAAGAAPSATTAGPEGHTGGSAAGSAGAAGAGAEQSGSGASRSRSGASGSGSGP